MRWRKSRRSIGRDSRAISSSARSTYDSRADSKRGPTNTRPRPSRWCASSWYRSGRLRSDWRREYQAVFRYRGVILAAGGKDDGDVGYTYLLTNPLREAGELLVLAGKPGKRTHNQLFDQIDLASNAVVLPCQVV